MVDGLTPHLAYYPVAALAALTAALVTLIVAVNAWRRSARSDESPDSSKSYPLSSDGSSKANNELTTLRKRSSSIGNDTARRLSDDTESEGSGLALDTVGLNKQQRNENNVSMVKCNGTDENSNMKSDMSSSDTLFLFSHGIVSDSLCHSKSVILEAIRRSVANRERSSILKNVDLKSLQLQSDVTRNSDEKDEGNADEENIDFEKSNIPLVSDNLTRSFVKTDEDSTGARESSGIGHNNNIDVGEIKCDTKKSEVALNEPDEGNAQLADISVQVKSIEKKKDLDETNFKDFISKDFVIDNKQKDGDFRISDEEISNSNREELSVDELENIENVVKKNIARQIHTFKESDDLKNEYNIDENDTKSVDFEEFGDSTTTCDMTVKQQKHIDVTLSIESKDKQIAKEDKVIYFREFGDSLDGVNRCTVKKNGSNKNNTDLKQLNYSPDQNKLTKFLNEEEECIENTKEILDDEFTNPVNTSDIINDLRISDVSEIRASEEITKSDDVFSCIKSTPSPLFPETKISRSLETVFFCYDITQEERDRSKLVIEDDRLSMQVDAAVIAKSMSDIQGETTGELATTMEYKIRVKQLLPVKFSPVCFKSNNSIDDKTNRVENLSDSSDRGKQNLASEEKVVKRQSPFPAEVGTESEDRAIIISVSGRDNGVQDENGRYSWSPSSDVTSEMHDGKAVVVQGSRRAKLIGKACWEAESKDAQGSPAYDGRRMQMEDTSCDHHDSTSIEDRLGRLDELVDQLRELASCGTDVQDLAAPVLIARVENGSDNTRASFGVLSEFYSSDNSNCTSDDNQSIGLSSINGETSSFSSFCFDSGTESPKLWSKKIEDESPFGKDPIACQLDQDRLCEGKESFNKSIHKIYNDIASEGGIPGYLISSEGTSDIEFSFTDPCENTMEESSRQVRLLKLLERDKQRLERQKCRLKTDSGNKILPSVKNDGQINTLKAMDTAIGHMQRQQLMQTERSPYQNFDRECRTEQYLDTHALRTIDVRNNAEARKFEVLSFKSLPPKTERREEIVIENNIYVTNCKSDNVEKDFAFSSSTNRWRQESGNIADYQKSFEVNEIASITEDSLVSSSTELDIDISSDSALGINKSITNVDFHSNLDSEKIREQQGVNDQCRWDRHAVGDVTNEISQSRPSGLRGDRAAAESNPPFSYALRQKQVLAMENGGCEMEKVTSPPPPPSTPTANAATNTTTTPTPTKIKNLRFKLDPDIFDLPSENGYYPDEDDNRRPGWKKSSKYQTFSALELGRSREPVKVVSVRTSIVPAGTKMVVKPVCVSEGQPAVRGHDAGDTQVTVKSLDIDLRIRLETEERDNNRTEPVVRGEWRASPEKQYRSHLYSSPAEIKKRSPVPDFSGWNQSLSPVSENCDWNTVPSAEDGVTSSSSEPCFQNKMFVLDTSTSFNDLKSAQNGKAFSDEEQLTDLSSASISSDNRISAPLVSTPSRPSTLELNHFRKHLQLPRKKFVPDPEAVERITGFKAAEETSTKPPLPPRPSHNTHRLHTGAKNRIDQLRRKYLDSKSMLAAQKADSSVKFEQFLNRAQEDRAKIATSTPDLAAFEAAVKDQWSRARNDSFNGSHSKENTPPLEISDSGVSVRSNTPDDVWINYVQMLRRQLNRRSQSMTYLETDVDAFFSEDKCQSMTTLERSPPNSTQSLAIPTTKSKRISMTLEESGRTKSEHELRIEKSLQNLTVPEWYKHSQRPKVGFLLDKKPTEKRGWAAIKSLTSSTTSLSSVGGKPRRPVRSLRNSQENLLWSRGSASPASADNSYCRYTKASNGPSLSLALAKAFREPYVGWRARTPSSCTSASPQVDFSPPSWVVMDNTDRSDTPLTSDLQAMDEEEDTGMSFDGEDVLEEVGSSDILGGQAKPVPDSPLPSADNTCDDIINISMDTCDHPSGHKEDSKSADLPGEDTCDDIKNITMDTFELFPPNANEEQKASPLGDDTCDDVLNISTDTSSHINPVCNGNQGTSSVMGATENTGVDIDDISTDTSNMVVSQENREHRSSDDYKTSNGSRISKSSLRNLTKDDKSLGNYIVDSKILSPTSNGNRNSSHSIHDIKDSNGDVFLEKNGGRHVSYNNNVFSLSNLDKHDYGQNRLDPKRKRYSYNRSIYQSELDGMKSKILISRRDDLDGSTQSLPGERNCRDPNKVIWIESSFVGSRTTTSIVVLPTEGVIKNKESNGSSSSVGRPASR